MKPLTKALIAGAAVASFAVLGFQIRRFLHQEDDRLVVRDFFVDEGTLAFEVHGTAEIPPLARPEQASPAVIAKCFLVDGERTIGWLERYPPAMKTRLEEAWAAGPVPLALLMESRGAVEVRAPAAGSPWVAAASEAGKAVTRLPVGKNGSAGMPVQPE